MFRHLSPKITTKETLPPKTKPIHQGQSPKTFGKVDLHQAEEKAGIPNKEIKNLNSFLGSKGNAQSKKAQFPKAPVITHTNSSTDNQRPVVDKKKSTFDDYY